MDWKDNLKRWGIPTIIILAVFLFIGQFGILSTSKFVSYGDGFYADTAMESGGSYAPSPSYGYARAMEDFAPEVQERKIQTTGSMITEVERGAFSQADERLHQIIDSAQGFILNENTREANERKIGDYSIKVPATSYESVISQLKEIGEVISFQENSRDVTGTVVDQDIELQAERERLLRLEKLYEERGNLEDKLRLENAIFEQERKIKYLEDSLNRLDKNVIYSSITYTLREEESEFAKISFLGFADLVRTFVGSVEGLLYFIASVLPWALGIGLVLWIVRIVRRD